MPWWLGKRGAIGSHSVNRRGFHRYCCGWAWLLGLTSSAGRGSFCSAFDFGSNKQRSTKAPTPLQLKLLDQASVVREKLGRTPPSYTEDQETLERVLYFESSYPTSRTATKDNVYERGYCNWLIPGYLMVGQYPGQTPEAHGPTEDDVEKHLERIVRSTKNNSGAHVRLFCSLQSELPSQADYDTWIRQDGMIFLEPESLRKQFPRPFTYYAPTVQRLCDEDSSSRVSPTFLHAPIDDLNVPESQEPLQELLLQLLTHMSNKEDGNAQQTAIYLHCWGGRGRAGLVGACLVSLIWPTLQAPQVLSYVQTGYASRLGHDQMPAALSQSPQTSSQRAFVTEFVQDYQYLYHKRKQERDTK